jgi:hypothetical protein
MISLEFAVKCVVLLLCVYPIVDRICRCKEQKYVSDIVKKFTDDNKQ